ncbi:MAG: TonB family protein [Sulfuritalea sp.]|nr:TonB family protein [Sulfuritalea sp.]
MPKPPISPRMPRFSRPALPSLPMPAFLAAMDAPQRNLTLAIGASLLIHALVLAVRFTPPDFIDKARERALDVILVNSKSKNRPDKAQAKAQANLDGGGNVDEDRRAKTPLPPSRRTKEGDRLIEAKRRVAELEAQTQAQMLRLKSERAVSAEKSKINPLPVPEPSLSGVDLASSALAIARLEGQIARQLEEYNKRPRKKNIGARVEEYRFAAYVEDWRQKIERIGNVNYPAAAKGRLYGSLLLTVTIKANGDLKEVEIDRSSGQPLLDEAARRIVRMAAPYAAFPESIRRDTDEIVITRTWTFTNDDRLSAD